MGCLDIPNETVFTMEMTPIKFGPGACTHMLFGNAVLNPPLPTNSA